MRIHHPILDSAFSGKQRLLLWLTILLIVGFAATSLVSYFVSRNSIRNQIVTNELPLTTDNVYSEIQKDLIRIVFISSMMAHDTFLRDWVIDGERNTAIMVKYLREIQQEYDTITSFFVSEKSRIYYNESGILKRVTESSPLDAWYFRVRKLLTPYELNIDPSEAHDNALTIFVNHRVVDYQGKLIGVIGVGQTVDSLRKLIDHYQNRYQRTVFLADRQGRVVLHGNDFPYAAGNIHAIDGLGDLAEEVLRGKHETYQYERNGGVYQLSSRFIPELGWHLLVEKSESAAQKNNLNTLLLNLAVSTLITLVIVLLTRISINRHQAHLRRVVERHTNELNAALNETTAVNQAKSQMLAFVSHDLRAPLSSILHYARLLGSEPGQGCAQYTTIIEQNILHQMALIDDLMEFSSGELEQLNVSPAPTYVHSFLQDIRVQGEMLAARRNNRFVMIVDEHVPPVAIFDPYRLRQVLYNLLSNAAKFTQGGDIQFLVDSVSEKTGKMTRLRFSVADTGSGIPKGDQQRVFLPYERSESEIPGSGLGLAIAQQVVEKMGGKLELESDNRKGCRFWFEIELERARDEEVLQPATPFSLPKPFGTGRRILLIEANPDARDYISELLAVADFDVEHADSIDDGLESVREQFFDAVLITGDLPQPSAWDFLRTLRELHPANAPRVILCSSTPLQQPDDISAELVFSAFLLKPIDAEKLLQKLRRTLGAPDNRKHSATPDT